MITVQANTASELVYRVLSTLEYDYDPNASWRVVGPRGLATRELRRCSYQLVDPARCATWLPERRLNYPFMVAEWLWIFCGRQDVEMIGYYNENIKQFSDDSENFFGAYGPRWRAQVANVVALLEKDPDSRQGAVSLWRPEYHTRIMTTRDVPCTLSIQYLVRDRRLECDVCMRSSDAWLGLPYDLFNFAMLQRCVAAELKVEPGPLTLQIASSHLYQRDLERVREVLRAGAAKYREAHKYLSELLVPAPPGIGHTYIQQAENNVRHGLLRGDDTTFSVAWAPFLSMLDFRRHKDPTRVHSALRLLVSS